MQNDNLMPIIASISIGIAAGIAAYLLLSQQDSTAQIEKTMKKETGQPIPTTNFF